MIQRKQTLWLSLMAFICFSSLYINIPFYEVDGKLNGKVVENAIASVGFSHTVLTIEKDREKKTDNIFLKYATLISGLISTGSIFLFKNRKRQMLLCNLNYVITFVMSFFMYYYGWMVRYVDEEPSGQIIISITFPIILLLANFKAISLIKADEKLVKSYDRIR